MRWFPLYRNMCVVSWWKNSMPTVAPCSLNEVRMYLPCEERAKACHRLLSHYIFDTFSPYGKLFVSYYSLSKINYFYGKKLVKNKQLTLWGNNWVLVTLENWQSRLIQWSESGDWRQEDGDKRFETSSCHTINPANVSRESQENRNTLAAASVQYCFVLFNHCFIHNENL